MSGKSRLDEISIRSLGVIEQSNLEFGPGLNVVTGETGAGKTMILTALGLVLGGKSDSQLVRHGASRALVSATFSASGVIEASDYIDSGSLVLGRTVNSDGKSKATAGGVTVAASVLEDVGRALVEIHGQTANISLSKSARQRELLDLFGGADVRSALAEYVERFTAYNDAKKHLAEMKRNREKRQEQSAELEDFLAAGNRVKPRAGELDELDQELNRLSSVEQLRNATSSAVSLLDSEDGGAYEALASAKRALEGVVAKDEALGSIASGLGDSFFALQEAVQDLHRYIAELNADPERLAFLQERKASLTSFLKKYGKVTADDPVAQIISDLRSARTILNDLSGGDGRLEELEIELAQLQKNMVSAAAHLSQKRSAFALDLSHKVTEEIHQLSMPHTTFKVRCESPDYSEPFVESRYTSTGCDEVAMEIQGHQGAQFLPISKSASGGELSRIMLALEVVIAQIHPVGTYIFDEVDAGIGGKAAIEVGRRLSQLAENAQVIVVTHLPQVAAWATTHFTVTKESDGSVQSSGVHRLEGEERVEEIARMLAGLGESASAREHAAELLALRTSR